MSGFDITQLDVATGSDAGAVMEVTMNGEVVRDAAGAPITITLLGSNSEEAEKHRRRTANRRMDAARRGKKGVTAEDLERDTIDFMVAVTKGWTFTEMDGEPFPCTPENARKFWSDRRFRPIRDQADSFVGDVANFIKG